MIKGAWHTQVMAIVLKNATLQSHQTFTNICVAIFVVLIIGSLYFLLWLFSTIEVSSCPGGWVTGGSCKSEVLADFIFSASKSGLPGAKNNDAPLGPWGFTLSNYLIPSGKYSPAVTVQGSSPTSTGGLPQYTNRLPTVWSSMINATTPLSSLQLGQGGLNLNFFSMPTAGRAKVSADDFMFGNQMNVYKHSKSHLCRGAVSVE